MRRNLFTLTGILLLALPQFLFAQSRTVAVLTPFLAQPGTQLMVEGFEAAAKSKGWQVDVIDTSGMWLPLSAEWKMSPYKKLTRW